MTRIKAQAFKDQFDVEVFKLPDRNGHDTEPDWPEPDMTLTSSERLPAPELPLEIFGHAGQLISDLARQKNAPADYVAQAYLVGAASLIGNARWGNPKPGWREPTILWGMLVGEPSSAKSPALDTVLTPMKAIEKDLVSTFADDHDAWQHSATLAGIAEDSWTKKCKTAFEKGEVPPDKPREAIAADEPIRPRVVVNDVTVEKLAVIQRDVWRGMLVHRDELSGWLASMDKYSGGGDRGFWLESFGGRPYHTERQKLPVPITVDHLSLGVLGGIQPDRLASLLIKADNDGLLPRFMVTWPDPAPLSNAIIHADEDGFRPLFERLRSLSPEEDDEGYRKPRYVGFDDDARARLFDLQKQCGQWESETENGLLKSHTGKLPGIAVRIATTLLYLDWAVTDAIPPMRVKFDHIDRACRYIDYLHAMAQRAYAGAEVPGEERAASKIAKTILLEALHEVNVRDIQRRRLGGVQSSQDVTKAFLLLIQSGWLRHTRETPNGRSRDIYPVNPKVFG